jgi:hypothetical protein
MASPSERRCRAVGAALQAPPRGAAADGSVAGGAAPLLDAAAARLQRSGQLRSLRTRADGGLELVVQALGAVDAERQWRAQCCELGERSDVPHGLRLPTLEERHAILREFF